MSELQDAAIQAAETIQTASINRAPTRRDLAPSTAADTKQAVEFNDSADAAVDAAEVDDDEVPLSALRPLPDEQPRRAPAHLQLPDLRFEQSYLKSIEGTTAWTGIAFVTVKDQLFMPLIQGFVWSMAVAGWRHWNVATKFSGQTIGAKIRRWWWGVNNWTIPDHGHRTLRDEKMAGQMSEYYSTGPASAGSD